MGIFSDAVADSRPRAFLSGAASPASPASPTSPIPADQERSTMISEGEERPAHAGPRQGADPSPQKDDAAAASRAVEGVVRYRKGKRSTEEGTTNGHDKDFGRSENELLGERNRQGRTTNGLHVDLDAHESEPSFSGQTAVSSGPSFKREAELSGNTDSKRSNHLSNVSNEELDNGTVVPEGSQNPGKAPLLPEPEAVAPSAVKPAGALPPKENVTAEGRRERVFDGSAVGKAATPPTSPVTTPELSRGERSDGGLRPSPPAPLLAAHPDPRERGAAQRAAPVPSEPAFEKGARESVSRSGDGRAPSPDVATLPSPGGPGGRPGEGPGVRAAGHERPLAAPTAQPVAMPSAPPAVFAAPRRDGRDGRDRREASREPSGPRVQIGRLEVIVVAPAPAVAPAAPAAAPSPKPGALASRRYLRSL